MQPVVFRRAGLYKETYLDKVLANPKIKAKFRDFMDTKRQNPNQPFGASDKPFVAAGHFARALPGARHAHITHDLSIVYKVVGNQVFLYGFFTHDELGTGQPANMNRQKNTATRLSNQSFG